MIQRRRPTYLERHPPLESMLPDLSRPRDGPLRHPIAALGSALTFAMGANLLLEIAISGLQVGARLLPWWLPQFGTIGETVVVYSIALDLIAFVLTARSLPWLGYAYGRHRASSADG